MLKYRSLLFLVCCPLTAASTTTPNTPGQTRLLRTPTVSATQIAFAYANNIWIVDRAGGAARRLTTFQGQTTNPAFLARRQMGRIQRRVRGQHRCLRRPRRRRRAEASHLASRTRHRAGLDARWQVRPLRLRPRHRRAQRRAPLLDRPGRRRRRGTLPFPRGYQGKISPDGTHIAYRMNNSWDEERRNYRGGQNRPIWIVDLKTYDLVIAALDRLQGYGPRLGRRRRLLHLRPRRRGQHLVLRHQIEEADAGDEVH